VIYFVFILFYLFCLWSKSCVRTCVSAYRQLHHGCKSK